MVAINDARFRPPRTQDCPVCSTSTNLLLFSEARDGIVRNLHCVTCGHSFVSDEDRAGHQSETGSYRNVSSDIQLSEALKKRTEIRAAERAHSRADMLIEKQIAAPQMKVLEVGCSLGHLLHELKSQGCLVAGCEADTTYARLASEYLSIEVNPGFFQLSDYPRGSFDLVILSHVLEHVPDVGRFLTEVGDVVSDSGSIYVEVPCLERPFSGDLRRFFWSEHLHTFSCDSLRTLASRCGLEIQDMWFSGFFLSARLSKMKVYEGKAHLEVADGPAGDYRWQTLLQHLRFLETRISELERSLE